MRREKKKLKERRVDGGIISYTQCCVFSGALDVHET